MSGRPASSPATRSSSGMPGAPPVENEMHHVRVRPDPGRHRGERLGRAGRPAGRRVARMQVNAGGSRLRGAEGGLDDRLDAERDGAAATLGKTSPPVIAAEHGAAAAKAAAARRSPIIIRAGSPPWPPSIPHHPGGPIHQPPPHPPTKPLRVRAEAQAQGPALSEATQPARPASLRGAT